MNQIEYRENTLSYQDYCRLRESVGWQNFSQMQAEQALRRSLYTVTAADHGRTVGMGRLIGDGLYYLIADIVVSPPYQNHGIGSEIIRRLIQCAEVHTPSGGRTSIQLIAEQGTEPFYENLGFHVLFGDFRGTGMRKVIRK